MSRSVVQRPLAAFTPSPVSDGHRSEPSFESVLAPLSQRYILVYPVLQAVTGSAKAALMLSQMLYWTRTYLTSRPERGGWFWHTQQDWRTSTGLSRHEQDHARAALLATGFVEERRMGVPGRMHFRVDLDALGRAIAGHKKTATNAHWTETTLKALLGRPVAFLRGLVDIGGSFTAGYYLSDLCQQQRTLERNALQGYITLNGAERELDAGDGWLDLPLGDTAKRLGLTTRRLRLARQRLIAAGLIEEGSSGGVQPRTLSRVNLSALTGALSSFQKTQADPSSQPTETEKPAMGHTSFTQSPLKTGPVVQQAFDFPGMAEPYIPEVTKPANWNGGTVHSRGDKTGNPEVAKPANNNAAFVTSINGVSTQKESLKPQLRAAPNEDLNLRRRRSSDFSENSGQTPTPARDAIVEQTSCAVDLVLPDDLIETERTAARHLLDRLPTTVSKQAVADEWAGQLGLGKVLKPMSYLHGLVKRAQRGDFVPALALQIGKNRERRWLNEAALARARDPRSVGAKTDFALADSHPPDEPARRKGVPGFFMDTIKELGLQARSNECRI